MENMEKVVYLDNAATTACAPEVLAVMVEALNVRFSCQGQKIDHFLQRRRFLAAQLLQFIDCCGILI